MTPHRDASSPKPQRALRRLPKTHLHAHLDGSYPQDAVEALARRRGMAFRVPDRFADVWAFFKSYETVPGLIETHDDLAVLCRALVEAEAAEGVVYLEPAIEPQLYAPRLGSLDQVTRTILGAFAEASQDCDVEVGALLTINTDENLAIADDLARLAAAHAGRGVTALGTAGFVEPGDLGRFRSAAQIAHAAGLPVVSHAGQTGGPDSIAEALDALGATRIGHGFRAIESPALVARLAAERIVCDICPVSNARLGVVPDIAQHPAPRLKAAGVPVTLNADDQLWFGAGITDQYEIARAVWGLDDESISGFARAGALATGMSASTRTRLLTGIDAWLGAGGAP
jgi:adenosine deaminase